MTAAEFLYDLRKRLRKLPHQEANAALSYYEEYFAEAGPGGEAALIDRLGSPAQVASTIISDYAIKDLHGQGSSGVKRGGLKTLWIVIIAVLASPIAIPLAIALIAVVFSILVSIAAVYLSLFVTAMALAACGVGLVVMAVIALFSQPVETVLLLGVGLICLAVGLALFLGMVKLSQLTVRGITWIFAHALGRKGGRQ